MDISFCCDKCKQDLLVDEAGTGTTMDCPKCGKPVYIPNGPRVERKEVVTATVAATDAVQEQVQSIAVPPASPPIGVSPLSPNSNKVVITGIKIPFVDMVVLMIKWALAAIPAAIIVFGIFFIIWLGITGLFFGWLLHGTPLLK